MAPTLEFEGKTVEKAVEQASQKLNIPARKLKHDVISYGSSGIFGLVGSKRAKIRVSVPESDRKPKAKKTTLAKQTATKQEAAALVEEAFDTPNAHTEVAAQAEKPTQTKQPAAKQEAAALVEEAFDTLNAHTEVAAQADKPTPTKQPAAKQEAAALVEEAFDPPNAHADLEAVEKLGRDALRTVVDYITTEATIESDVREERIFYNVTGGNSAVLIGKRGQTLEAMQYLVEKIVNKQSDKRVRIEIDVEGYLEKKRDKLKNQALKLGEKVKQTKRPATVGQLNAYDRRIVHLALKADSELRTHSIGEGFYRKLKIYPKQRRRKGKSHKPASK